MALREFDQVVVRILDEAHGHRPSITTCWPGHYLGAGCNSLFKQLVDVIRGHIELPERIAHVKWTSLIDALRELEFPSLFGVLDDGFFDLAEISPAGVLESEAFVET